MPDLELSLDYMCDLKEIQILPIYFCILHFLFCRCLIRSSLVEKKWIGLGNFSKWFLMPFCYWGLGEFFQNLVLGAPLLQVIN